jgi:K+-transporting ATPase A subunit
MLWLVAYCALTLFVCTVALLMFGEALALLKKPAGGLGAVVASGLVLVAWPVSALVGLVAAARGKARVAWLATSGTAGATLVLYVLAAVVHHATR